MTNPLIPENAGLVLEGGGLRGTFSAGVIRFIMEQKIEFPYVIGVSAGACNGSNYVSRQIDRNKIVNIDFINHPEYISVKRWLTGGDLFGMDFLFDALPNSLAPFDYKAFLASHQKMVIGATDCHTGKAVFHSQHDLQADYLPFLRASCSLPLLAKPVFFNGMTLMDGGLSDPIPIQKCISDGIKKQVVVLTRPEHYRKKKSKLAGLMSWKFRTFGGLVELMKHRHDYYNATLKEIEQLEKDGSAFVFRPSKDQTISRTERDEKKLIAAYEAGYQLVRRRLDEFKEFLEM